MKTRITLSVFAALMTAAVVGLSAQERERGFDRQGQDFMPMQGERGLMGRMDNPMRLFRMAERLELSKDQREQITGLMDESRPKIRDNMFKVMDARKELQELTRGDTTISDRKLRELTREQGESMAEMMYLRLKLRSDIRALLTEEQLTRFSELHDHPGRAFRDGDRREKMRERFRERRRQG